MIVDAEERVIIDHAGWGEDYKLLWRYNLERGVEEKVQFANRGFHLRSGFDRRNVRVSDRLADGAQRFTVRPIVNMAEVRAEAIWSSAGWTFSGNDRAWDLVPRFACVWLQGVGATALLHLDPGHPEPDPLEWWRRGPFDHGYQGILEPYEVPGSTLIIVCVQRHDRLILYDPDTREVVGDVGLTTPSDATVHFRTHADEVWVKEYDAVSRFRPRSWERLDTLRLQDTGGEFTREPIGSLSFPPDEEYCLIARPMSEDVVFLDTQTFGVVDSVHLGMEPLDAIALRDGAVFARDWQTRTLLRGHRA